MGVFGNAAAGAAVGAGGSIAAGAAAGSVVPVVGTIIGAGIGAVASIFSAKKQSKTATNVASQQIKATEQASAIEEEAAKRELEFLREQDALDRRDAETKRLQDWQLSEATRSDNFADREANRKMDWGKYITRQTNLSPYMGMGKSSTYTLAGLMGLSPESMAMPDPKTTNPYVGATYTPVPYVPLSTDSRIPESFSTTTAPAASAVASSTAKAPLVSTPTAATSSQGQTATVPLSSVTGALPLKSQSFVLMQAPDGSQQSVPASAVPYFQKQGAWVAQAQGVV